MDGIVLKSILHFAFCLLLAVALVWGGCLQPMHRSCCDAAGHCGKHRASPGCQTEPVALAKALAPERPKAQGIPTAAVILPIAVVHAVAAATPALRAAAASPPDLCLLHSVLRI